MAIDAIIRGIREAAPGEGTADDYVLELGPRGANPPGQRRLILLAPRRPLPPVGATIWGSASTIHVATPAGEMVYRREGYTRIREG